MQTTVPERSVNGRRRGPRLSGSKIEQARLAKGLTVTELAAAVGRCERAVRFWEARDVQPHRTVLPHLTKALGVTVKDLLA